MLRELGAREPVAGAAPGRAVWAAATLIIISSSAAALAVAAQGSALPRGLIVSSLLERIGATADDDADVSGQSTTDTSAHADQLIVNVRFTNASDRVLDSIRITSPIPPDLRYVQGSASGPGADVLFSVDDGRSFGRPEELTVQAPDGSVRGADPAEYTHVRWVLRAPLDAGALGIARFRVVPR